MKFCLFLYTRFAYSGTGSPIVGHLHYSMFYDEIDRYQGGKYVRATAEYFDAFQDVTGNIYAFAHYNAVEQKKGHLPRDCISLYNYCLTAEVI